MRQALLWMRCALFLALALALGCTQPPPPVYPVSGTVTLNGKPLAEGSVYFKTVQTGAMESFAVKDGEFAGTAQEGERRVEINAFRTKTGNFNGMKGEVKENLIPARYNRDSTLSAKVTPEGPNKFAFTLSSK